MHVKPYADTETGLAPVTRASGRMHQVRFRYAANSRMRHAIDCWAFSERVPDRLRGPPEPEQQLTTQQTRSAVKLTHPIEAHFGPLRTFVVNGSNHPNHPVATRALHDHLRWRNANARHPDILAAQRRERARIRSERRQRWGDPRPRKAA